MSEELWIDPAGLRSVASAVREAVTPLTQASTSITATPSTAGSSGHPDVTTALANYAAWWGPYATALADAVGGAADTMEATATAFETTDGASANAFARATTGPGLE
mgnify:FL=1